MAYFVGTIREFTKFLGAYARIKVMHLAAKHKKVIGKCEHCNADNKTLEAAHINGKERPVLITNILSQFVEDDIVKIDLHEFEERFIDAHYPIENTIKVLCKKCHRIYDNAKIIHENIPLNAEVRNVLEIENYEANETDLIEKLVSKSMSKSQAIDLANQKLQLQLKNDNTLYSNINASKDVWWLEPYNDKFNSQLNFILHDAPSRKLFVFIIPARTIKDPDKQFHQRNDKIKSNCSQIIIPVSGLMFIDRKGYDFTAFLVKEIQY
jgi:hypothetical protein